MTTYEVTCTVSRGKHEQDVKTFTLEADAPLDAANSLLRAGAIYVWSVKWHDGELEQPYAIEGPGYVPPIKEKRP